MKARLIAFKLASTLSTLFLTGCHGQMSSGETFAGNGTYTNTGETTGNDGNGTNDTDGTNGTDPGNDSGGETPGPKDDNDGGTTYESPFCPPMVWAVYYPWFRDVYPYDHKGDSVEELTEDRNDLKNRVEDDWDDEFEDHPIGPPDMGGHGMFSYDIIALELQVHQALDAGIDGFLPYYRGLDQDHDGRPHYTEGSIALLFAAVNAVNNSRGSNFRIGIHLSAQAADDHKHGKDVEDRMVEWTERFLSMFGNEESLMRIDGRVLAVAYSTGFEGKWSPSRWRTYRNKVGNDVFMVADNGSSNSFDDYLEHFDGTINRGVPDRQSSIDNARERGMNVADDGKLWLGEVRPNKKKTPSQRESTDFFKDSFEQAEALGARWLRLVSWNEYAEFTHIEPSGDYGDTFLKAATREIAAWKASALDEFCR